MSKKKIRTAKNSKMRTTIVIILVVAFGAYLFISLFGTNEVKQSHTLQRFTGFDFTKQGELSFNTDAGEFVNKIDIEIADTPEKRQTGLMYRVRMKENRGMLFIFDREEPQSFWMRNTEISLDIIFVNSDLEIVKIHHNTKPFSDSSLPSIRPAKFVVEVNAGYCEKFGISEGNKIVWRRN